jgi:hypothetical protein
MNEKKYLKIISDLFRLTGYATGIISGLRFSDGDNRDQINNIIKYLEEQQNLILMQLGREDQE